MKATHTDYMHPKHLRVETGGKHNAWSIRNGWHGKAAFCMAPSHSQYTRLNRPGLPSFSAKPTPEAMP